MSIPSWPKGPAQVGIVLSGEAVMPGKVTQEVALKPTRSFTKGEKINGSPEHSRPWGLWAIEIDDASVEGAAKQLLSLVQSKSVSIRRSAIQMGARVTLSIWWDPPEGQGGFEISSATMAQLCALVDQVDVYFPGGV